MVTFLVRRLLPLLGFGAVLGLVVRRIHSPAASGDTWFHLRMGNEFLRGWDLAHPGHLGVYDTATWAPTQWLAQIGMARLVDSFGLTGLLWVGASLQLLLVLIVYLMCRGVSAPLPATLATLLCFAGMAAGLSIRPQVLSYLLAAVCTWAWLATARDGRARWWLVLVGWAWVPLHGMWPVAILLGAAMAVGISIDHGGGVRQLLRLGSIPAATALLALATPLGTATYTALFSVGSRGGYFEEWGAPDLTDPRVIGVSIMAAIVVALGLRHDTLSWSRIMLVGTAVVWALYAYRTAPLAAVILAPLLAEAIQHHLPQAPRPGKSEAAAVGAFLVAAVLVAGLVASVRSTAQAVPGWLDETLDSQPRGAKVLNSWDVGSYLLWRHPGLHLAMHGYGDVFTDEELERNVRISTLQPGWDREVDALDADLAVVQTESALAYALVEHAGWHVVRADEWYEVLEPPASAQPAAARAQAAEAAIQRSRAAAAAPESIAAAALATPADSDSATSASGHS